MLVHFSIVWKDIILFLRKAEEHYDKISHTSFVSGQII